MWIDTLLWSVVLSALLLLGIWLPPLFGMAVNMELIVPVKEAQRK